MKNRCLCIDVGGSSIKYALIDNELNLYKKGSVVTPNTNIEDYVNALCSIYEKFRDEVYGIALSVPGIIDSKNGLCITGGSLLFIEKFNIVEVLQDKCGVPISVMNDAKCASLAEAKWGALSDCNDGIVIVLGTGIGGAIIKDKKIHQGKHFGAGEFSFINLNNEFDGDENKWFNANGNLKLISLVSKAKGIDASKLDGYKIFEMAKVGDEIVLKVIDKFTRSIANMILNIQLIYDPDKFAIGGGISSQPLLLEYINKNVDFYNSISNPILPKPDVVACKFYNDSNLIGAYANYLNMHSEN